MSDASGRDPLLHPGRRAAVLHRLGQLTVDDLRALDAAVVALCADRPYRGRVDKGFWLAWYEGPRLTTSEGRELGELFPAVVIAIATGLSGLDVRRFGAGLKGVQQRGFAGDVMRVLRSASAERQLQAAAIGLIEDAVAPADPRLAIVACWNMACGVTLGAHLPAEVADVLERAWRRALGELPA